MKINRYFRDGKITKGLEVTKAELENILKKVSYISVSEADKNNLENLKEDEVVGVIMGDFTNILRGVMMSYEYEAISNPDCSFVNKDIINKNYKDIETSKFTFGEAIELLKSGFKVAREGWNGKGMYLFLLDLEDISLPGKAELLHLINRTMDKNVNQRDIKNYKIDPFIVMYTAQKTLQPGWLASQADMLSEDWIIIE